MRLIIKIGLSLSLLLLGQAQAQQQHYTQVKIGKTIVNAQLSVSEAEHIRGLQHVRSLPADAGMLFIYSQPGKFGYWMQEMQIPLDMIWLDSKHRIVDMTKRAPVCTQDPCPIYRPKQPAQYVLEVNAGFADQHQLKEGMKVDFQL